MGPPATPLDGVRLATVGTVGILFHLDQVHDGIEPRSCIHRELCQYHRCTEPLFHRFKCFFKIGLVVIALVFQARAIFAYSPWAKRIAPEQPFRRLDETRYGPLCGALGMIYLAVAASTTEGIEPWY